MTCKPLVTGQRYAVAAGHPLAAMAASEIMRSGGNAIDAGVAAGIALRLIFNVSAWYLTILVLLVMLIAAGFGALGRLRLRGSGAWLVVVTGIGIVSFTAMAVMFALVVPVRPWYDPRYFIPIAGMVVGNSMTAAALVLSRFHGELRLRRAEVESRLALAADAGRASATAARSAIRAASIPILANLATVGMVQLPGMMTGQIIAGVEPTEAIRYQIVIMYVLLATVMATALLCVRLARRLFFTPAHQLRRQVFDTTGD